MPDRRRPCCGSRARHRTHCGKHSFTMEPTQPSQHVKIICLQKEWDPATFNLGQRPSGLAFSFTCEVPGARCTSNFASAHRKKLLPAEKSRPLESNSATSLMKCAHLTPIMRRRWLPRRDMFESTVQRGLVASAQSTRASGSDLLPFTAPKCTSRSSQRHTRPC